MLLAIYEIVTIGLLLIAAISGFMALRSLSKKQKRYSLRKLNQKFVRYYDNNHLRRFLVYFAVAFSTAAAALAAFLRFVWIGDVGWDNAGNRWAFWWLTAHSINAISFTAFHLLIYMKQKRLKDESS